MVGKYQGELNGLTGSLLHGWAFNPKSPDERVVVEVYLDGISLGVTVANIFEPDLKQNHIGDGEHGFSFILPALAREHGGQLRVRIANTSIWLGAAISVDKQIEKLDSQVFTDGGLRITGWASELSQPGQPVTIQLSTDDGVFIEQLADKYSALASPRDKFCGFDISLPLSLADGKAHKVQLTTDSGDTLKGSPITIACYPEGDAGYFQTELAQHIDDPKIAETFTELLHENRHYTPRSIDFAQYPQWFELFGAPRHALKQRKLQFDLRWVGTGAKRRTIKSLQQQTHTHWAFDERGQ